MFVDRRLELDFLNRLLIRAHPGPAQLVLMYGRRRVGKTELLLQWAEQSVRQRAASYTYWEAVKENATQQRARLFAKLLNVPVPAAPVYRSWPDLWDAAAPLLQTKAAPGMRHILILDELPYSADADPAMLSSLQYAWDQHFQKSGLVIVLCGSHVRVMETLLSRQSPLFGRMTAQWHLEPLPFSSLSEFFPKWNADERVAVYAILGGIPAYINWLDPKLDLIANIRQVILSPGSMFLAEPDFLLYDEVREPNSYLAVMKAIGSGAHTLTEIGERAFIPSTSVNFYLNTLQALRLVERRLPVTQPKAERGRSRSGRYHLSDPYFRFYFQFLEPFLSSSPFDPDQVIEAIRRNLRAFVGGTAFEDLARQWVWAQGKAGQLPFTPDSIGSHWSRRVQIDVVALNWKTHEILLGECKWGSDRIDRQVVRELVEKKTPLLLKDLPGEGGSWHVHYALFGRSGFTPAAADEMKKHQGILVDLKAIDQVLGH
jgi:AAA+ ATPase superfamily predicted ATPase